MEVPEVFKYGSVIAVPLFVLISIFIVRNAENYSFRQHTVSRLITFLEKSHHRVLFRINFVLVGILNLCFSFYVLGFFKISIESFVSFSLLTSAILFGSLAYFIEEGYELLHKFIVYTSGILWGVGQILVASTLGNRLFLFFTIIAISIPLLIGFGSAFSKKTNVLIQITCVSIWYLWLLIFVFKFL